MKLLDWMHRKFCHNSSETLKDFLMGQPSLDDQQCYQKLNSGVRDFKQDHREKVFRNSFAGLDAEAVEEDGYEGQSVAEISELFHGFLTIGTLGSEPSSIDLATPTFTYSVEYITEKETEVTEDELKLINDELEQVLAAEVDKEWGNESSGRNSYVSTGRSSHGSTITLSGKPMEGPETNGNRGGAVCPLQEYLFGSAVESTETPKMAKKEQRTSLGELFQRTKMGEDSYGGKVEKEERPAEKEKSTMHLMKKLKKKVLPAGSRSSTTAAGRSGESTSAEKRLQKLLQMFHRKVHPEYSTGEQENGRHQAAESKKKTADNSHNNGEQALLDEDILIYAQRTQPKKNARSFKSHISPPHFTLSGNDLFENKELWINTDADYLVLEL